MRWLSMKRQDRSVLRSEYVSQLPPKLLAWLLKTTFQRIRSINVFSYLSQVPESIAVLEADEDIVINDINKVHFKFYPMLGLTIFFHEKYEYSDDYDGVTGSPLKSRRVVKPKKKRGDDRALIENSRLVESRMGDLFASATSQIQASVNSSTKTPIFSLKKVQTSSPFRASPRCLCQPCEPYDSVCQVNQDSHHQHRHD